MTFSDFRRLRLAVSDCSTFDSFLLEEGGSVDCENIDLLIRQLDAVYNCKNVKDIRNLTGLSQAAFSAEYGIPRRSVENWESETNKRELPEYTCKMILFAVISDMY